MVYKDVLPNRNVMREPTSVKQPIRGREDEMVPSAGSAGYTFGADKFTQFKRWLAFGSTGSTMYASDREMTTENLDVVKACLADDYRLTLDILRDASVNNLVPKQTPLLVALSMALSYEDKTIRVRDTATDEVVMIYELPEAVHTIGLSPLFNGELYAWTFNHQTGSGHHLIKIDWDTAKAVHVGGRLSRVRLYTGLEFEHDIIIQDRVVTRPVITVYSYDVREYASEVAREMLRQSSQLFEALMYTSRQRGRGSVWHKVVTQFYKGLNNRELAFQLLKFGSRSGLSHRDLLRLVKPSTTHKKRVVDGEVVVKELPRPDVVRSHIFGWAVGKFDAYASVVPESKVDAKGYLVDPLTQLWAADALKYAQTAHQVANLISTYKMPREAVERANTEWLKERVVWEALLPNMPVNALLRNLRNMAQVGLLVPFSDAERFVVSRLEDVNFMRKAHPIQILQAVLMYDPAFIKGQNAYDTERLIELRTKGMNNVKPYMVSQPVIDAGDAAFHRSFGDIEPTDKNVVLSVDVSGSMWWHTLPSAFPLFPAEAAAVMATTFAHREKWFVPFAFSNGVTPMKIGNKTSLIEAVNEAHRHPASNTNIGAPIEFAMANRMRNVDVFVSCTDVQNNYGLHPAQLLEQYRQFSGRPTRMITIAMEANSLSVADPHDRLSMDVAGFSSDTPAVVSQFITGLLD